MADAKDTDTREAAMRLMERKDLLQAELDTQFAILASAGVTMSTPLVDEEGFPRADLDVYAIRHARVRVIELRNDMNAVMEEMGKALEGVFDRGRVNGVSGGTAKKEMSAFARVDGVAPGSPAAEAGLRREDLLVQLGEVTAEGIGGGSLQRLGDAVNASRNTPMTLIVLRGLDRVELRMTPRANWGGRGLIGCHLVPL